MDNTDLTTLPSESVTDESDNASAFDIDVASLPTSSPSSMLVLDRHIQHAAFYNPKPPLLRLDVLPFLLLYSLLLFLAVPALHYELDVADAAALSASPVTPAALLPLVKNDTEDDDLLSASSSFTEEAPAVVIPAVPAPPSYHFYAMYLLPVLALLHGLTFLSAYWSIRIKTALRYSQVRAAPLSSRVIRILPALHCGAPALCPMQRAVIDGAETHFFVFQKTKYVYSPASSSFPACFVPLSYPTALPVSSYLRSTGLSASPGVVEAALSKFGPNVFDIPLPLFMDLYVEHAMAPFFLFQVLCVLLWCLDEYWYYSLMTLFMLVSFEATVVKRRLKHLEYVRDMRQPAFRLFVHRDKGWEQKLSSDLLPGDIVSMTRTVGDSVCPCDLLMLSGQAVVNEALLTGESVPQVKEPVDLSEGDVALAMGKQHKRHVLYGGTKVLMTSHKDAADDQQLKPAVKPAPDGGCVCYVLKTGFASGQGKLVRTILYSTERVSVNNTESLLFILFLLVFAVMASGYVLYHGLQDKGRSRYKLLLNCVDENSAVTMADGSKRRIKHVRPGDLVLAYHRQRGGALAGARVLVPRRVQATLERGEKACIELSLSDGRTLCCTPDHRLLVENGQWLEARDVLHSGLQVAVECPHPSQSQAYAADEPEWGGGKKRWAVSGGMEGAPLFYLPVISMRAVGTRRVYDLSVPAEDGEDEASFVANGIAVHNCVMIITSVVPPELPMELSLAVNTSLMQLAQQQIFCTEPFRIPLAGAVDVCCFDKTGTLTADEFKVSGIAGLGAADGLQAASDVADDVKFVIAGCHSLAHIAESGLVGDPLEKAALAAIRYSYSKSELAVSETGRQRVRIMQRFAFTSVLKRMSCVVALDHDGNAPLRVVVKGAAEVIEPMLSVKPSWYSACHQLYARRGCRVLALAYRVMKQRDTPDDRRAMRDMRRDELESGLTFAGFLVLQCPLKPDSKEVVRHLMDSSHAVVMITGDNTLTACSVAADLSIVTRDVAILSHCADGSVAWLDADNAVVATLDRSFSPASLASLSSSRDLCVSGEAIEHLTHHERVTADQVGQLIPFVKVFARFSPDLKELVLTRLKLAGKVTLMAGDGTNDCLEEKTPVMLADGRGTKLACEVVQGDQLLGTGGRTAVVTSAPFTRAEAAMYRLTAASGSSFAVTPGHLVTLAWRRRTTVSIFPASSQFHYPSAVVKMWRSDKLAPVLQRLRFLTPGMQDPALQPGFKKYVVYRSYEEALVAYREWKTANCQGDEFVTTDLQLAAGRIFGSIFQRKPKKQKMAASFSWVIPGRAWTPEPIAVSSVQAAREAAWAWYHSVFSVDAELGSHDSRPVVFDHSAVEEEVDETGADIQDEAVLEQPTIPTTLPDTPPSTPLSTPSPPSSPKVQQGKSVYIAGYTCRRISTRRTDKSSPYGYDKDRRAELPDTLPDADKHWSLESEETRRWHPLQDGDLVEVRADDLAKPGVFQRLTVPSGGKSPLVVLLVNAVPTVSIPPAAAAPGGGALAAGVALLHRGVLEQARAVADGQPVCKELFQLMTADDAFRPLVAADNPQLALFLHSPLTEVSLQNTSGQQALTVTQLRTALRTLSPSGISAADGVFITALNPIAAKTSKMDSTHSQYSTLCKASMQLALATGAKAIVACGKSARLRWRAHAHELSGVVSAETAYSEADYVWSTWLTMEDPQQPRVRVVYSPHPCHQHKLLELMLAIRAARVHLGYTHAPLTEEELAGLERSASADMVELKSVARDPTATTSVGWQVDGDGRFVLGNSILTHNCGALKQAHVGVALIGEEGEKKKREAEEAKAAKEGKEEKKAVAVAPAALSLKPQSTVSKFQQAMQLTKKVQADAAAAERASGRQWSMSERNGWVKARFSEEMRQLQGQAMADEPPPIRLGDASIASPFTSKLPYISSTVSIIRQGRCTLVTTLQMFAILGVNSLISAYAMSVLYLQGVKMADTQMTFSGLSIAMFFLFVSRSRPMDRLSAERPQSRIFTAHMMLGILGQFALHMLTLLTAVQLSLPHTPTDADTKSPDTAFQPNVLNTVVYLVSTTATTATFIANYRGHPFMQSLRDNTWLFRALVANVLFVLLMASGAVQEVNDLMKLADMPSLTLRLQLMTLVLFDLCSTVVYSNMLKRIFAIRPKKSGPAGANGLSADSQTASRLKAE